MTSNKIRAAKFFAIAASTLIASVPVAAEEHKVVVKSVSTLIEKNHLDMFRKDIRIPSAIMLTRNAPIESLPILKNNEISEFSDIETFDPANQKWVPGLLGFHDDLAKHLKILNLRDIQLVSDGEIVFANRALEYKSVYYFQRNNLPNCTAVGLTQSSIVTAKHCIVDSDNIVLELENQEIKLSQKCSQHPSADIAICNFDTKLISPAVVSSQDIPKKSLAEIAGVGCDEKRDDFNFRTGPVSVILSASQTKSGDILKFKGLFSNKPESKRAVAICPGDSGGPTFINKGYKELIGINRYCKALQGSYRCTSSGISYATALFPHKEWVDRTSKGNVVWSASSTPIRYREAQQQGPNE